MSNVYKRVTTADPLQFYVTAEHTYVRLHDQSGPLSTMFVKVDATNRAFETNPKTGDVKGWRLQGVHTMPLTQQEAARWKTALNRFGRAFETFVNKGMEFNSENIMATVRMFLQNLVEVLKGEEDTFSQIPKQALEELMGPDVANLAEAPELNQEQVEELAENDPEQPVLPTQVGFAAPAVAPKPAPIGFVVASNTEPEKPEAPVKVDEAPKPALRKPRMF